MHKLLFFFMICLIVGLTIAYHDKERSYFKNEESSRRDHTLSQFCSNNTVAQAYLTQILLVIDALEANSSYNSVLNLRSANFIKYLKDSTNQNLLSSDCESFMVGLKAAKKADKEIELTQKKLARIIQKQIQQVTRDVTNGKGFYEFDSSF